MAVETAQLSGLAARVVEAYGGVERWANAQTAHARFDCGGLLFNWKRGSKVFLKRI